MSNNNNNNNSNPYHALLIQICEFLTENKAKSEYIVDLYYQRDNIEFEELSLLETQGAQAQRIETKLYAKNQEIEKIKTLLKSFRDEKMRSEASKFLQWINYQADPPSMFLYKYPSDLKGLLKQLKRYDNDLQMMSEDVNNKFKYFRA